ncbi:MAG: phosphoribosylformylglycinamidine cyclo-ligase, partial [Elusimicrobia bacterium]|nr:phosphoribosylformylglycinamidine cyclo-ligase [Elusimicrobiota bacterium]
GVNIDAGDALVDYIQKKAPAIGGFAGLFPLNKEKNGYSLVACTDGVGTKLKLAFMLNEHRTIGIDLVAMCVNDLIVCGAKPLFFLDYYATGKLDLKKSRSIMDGIMEGCRQGKMALLGGETAEMPGFYQDGEYDLAGFSVGIVKNSEVIDGSTIKPGDILLGLASSGFHSNGYSLIRHIYKGAELKKRAKKLLAPTRIYVAQYEKLSAALAKAGHKIAGMAHITGGGLLENVPRFLPKNCSAVIDKTSWRVPEIMAELAKTGNVAEKEMWRTFNMGIGLVIALKPQAVSTALKALPEAFVIGEISRGKNETLLK